MNRIKYLFLMCLLVAKVYGSNYKIISNKNLLINKISIDELRDIYLGKKIFWDGKLKISSTYLCCPNKVTTDFIQNVVGKDMYRFQRYWRRKLFSGSGVPPKRFRTSYELLSFISRNEGAIGIIDENISIDNNVKEVEVKK